MVIAPMPVTSIVVGVLIATGPSIAFPLASLGGSILRFNSNSSETIVILLPAAFVTAALVGKPIVVVVLVVFRPQVT